jgi:hypothetical protein
MTKDDDIIPRDMRDVLEEFAAKAAAIITPFATVVEALPLPSHVYHYTNDAGLQGILHSGTLWLTDIFDLNDPSELRHGFAQATRILKGRAAAGPPESDLFAGQFERFLIDGGIEAAAHFFVCSFSKSGDELGQWRAYADNGRGYSLGFDPKLLEDGFTKKDGVPIAANSTFPVTYDDAELAGLQHHLMDEAFPLISLPRGRGLSPSQINAYMGDLLVYLSVEALRQVLFFKHHAYRSEAEYRFLEVFHADQPPPAALYRNRPYALVRYREYDWRAAVARALRQIVIGPSADPIKAPQFARDCLKAFHPRPQDVEVVNSEIPYRAV